MSEPTDDIKDRQMVQQQTAQLGQPGKIDRGVQSPDSQSTIQGLLQRFVDNVVVLRGCIEGNEPVRKLKVLAKVFDCIIELQLALDQAGMSIVLKKIDQLRGFMQERLADFHLQNDITVLSEMTHSITDIKRDFEAVLASK